MVELVAKLVVKESDVEIVMVFEPQAIGQGCELSQ
jgi:hypothetical protein